MTQRERASSRSLRQLANFRSSLQETRSDGVAGHSLSSLLMCTRHREATDPRDKVFSLFGLAVQVKKYALKINYMLSVDQLYAVVAALCLIVDQDLTILSGANPDRPGRTLPSWIPDWRLPSRHSLLDLTLDRRHRFCASGDIPASVAILVDGDCLVARGIVITEIANVTRLETGLTLPQQQSHRPLASVHSHYPVHILDPSVSILQPYANELLLDRGKDEKVPVATDKYPRATGSFIYREIKYELKRKNCKLLPDYDTITSNYLVFSGKNRLSYGLCPTAAQAGDLVCILFGGLVPFILRPDPIHGDCDSRQIHVSLIGECYIHDGMHGELVTPRARVELDTVELQIR
jgi:hypothetical protein